MTRRTMIALVASALAAVLLAGLSGGLAYADQPVTERPVIAKSVIGQTSVDVTAAAKAVRAGTVTATAKAVATAETTSRPTATRPAASTATATIAATYPVEITKYAFDEQSAQLLIDSDDRINNLPLEVLDDLKPLSGIAYSIQAIVPTGTSPLPSLSDPTSYQASGMPLRLTSDDRGQARTDLPEGYYIVSEQANPAKGLSQPAQPFILSLPTEWNAEDGVVHIYPKSSVDPIPTPQPEPEPVPEPSGGSAAGSRIASTGSSVLWLGFIAAGVLLGGLALCLSRRSCSDRIGD